MQPLAAVIASILIILASACPAQPQTTAPAAQPSYCVSGTLACLVGEARYSAQPDSPALKLAVQGALPYQVVALGPPALVTACGADLVPCTYVLAPDGAVQAYPGWVPLIVQPPLAAMMRMPCGIADSGLGVVLLDAGGHELYRGEQAELLCPAHEPPDYSCAYVVEASSDGDAMYPLGAVPELTAVALDGGRVQWSVPLQAPDSIADARLWAELDEWLLLSLQYGYEQFEFLAVSRKDGSVTAHWALQGIPGGATVYPGPVWEPQPPEINGACASIVVFNEEAGAWQRWGFDCAAGTLEQEACPPPETLREDNPLPVGGADVPGPGSAPFPQCLLPEEWGESWEIDALTDGTGRVLVVDGAGARWVEPGKEQ